MKGLAMTKKPTEKTDIIALLDALPKKQVEIKRKGKQISEVSLKLRTLYQYILKARTEKGYSYDELTNILNEHEQLNIDTKRLIQFMNGEKNRLDIIHRKENGLPLREVKKRPPKVEVKVEKKEEVVKEEEKAD